MQVPKANTAPRARWNPWHFLLNFSNCHITATQKDAIWILSRITRSGSTQNILAWGGFNSIISQEDLSIATVRYMPFIWAPPSQMTTIYTALLKLVQLAQALGQNHILVTADMAIYSKAQEILWSHPHYESWRYAPYNGIYRKSWGFFCRRRSTGNVDRFGCLCSWYS